ncbi:MAG: DUF4864 domain-containing protein [Polaromonas sp.]
MKAVLNSLSSGLGRLLSAVIAALVLVAAVHASPLTPTDEKNIRATVQGQLSALARDDASRAFSFAAENVRQAVGTAPAFLALVRRNYPVVYRPASVAFLKPESRGEQVIQRVQMLDASGDAWLAIYSLQRQKNKSWRITGCAVIENKGHMT